MVPSSALSAGTPVSVLLSDIPVGSTCVRAFLDVDGTGAPSSGDATSYGGDTPVTVMEGATADVSVSLDAIQP